MKKNGLGFFAAVIAALFVVGTAQATVIGFDDLGSYVDVPAGYAGLTWGSSTIGARENNTGVFTTWDNAGYATAHSAPNYVFNRFGADKLWFAFPSPVSFDGAWFGTAFGAGNPAAQVRMTDDVGHVSAWLTLSSTPQFLAANFSGSTTIWVERAGPRSRHVDLWASTLLPPRLLSTRKQLPSKVFAYRFISEATSTISP